MTTADDIPDESEQLDQLQPDDTLVDRGVDDVLDEGYTTAEGWSPAEKFGNTAYEQAIGESLDQRLAEELPDPSLEVVDESENEEMSERDAVEDELDLADIDPIGGDSIGDEEIFDGEVGDRRAGRLVDPDEGLGSDDEAELVGDDVGIDGAAASAEEAAVHVVDDESRPLE